MHAESALATVRAAMETERAMAGAVLKGDGGCGAQGDGGCGAQGEGERVDENIDRDGGKKAAGESMVDKNGR